MHHAETGEIVWKSTSQGGAPRSAAYSNDGLLVAIGTDQGVIQVLSAETGQEVIGIDARTDVFGLCFSHDGCLIFAPEGSDAVTAWDTATGDRVVQLPGVVQHVSSLAASLDGAVERIAAHIKRG